MFSLVSALVISALYFSVGIYHVHKAIERPGESQSALVAYGTAWIILGITYFWAGMSQVFYFLDQPVADKEAFYLNYTFAFGVIIPYYYFASYLLWGDKALSRRLMALSVVFFAVGVGLVWSTPVIAKEFGWGSTWDFVNKRVGFFYQVVGILPVAASLVAFMVFLYPHSDSKQARYRLAMTTLSFALLITAWSILVTRTGPAMFASRLLALASGISAHLAYFPLPFIRRRIGKG